MLGLEARLGLARAWSDASLGMLSACWGAYAGALAQATDMCVAAAPRLARGEGDARPAGMSGARSWYSPATRASGLPALPSRSAPSARSWYRAPGANPFAIPPFGEMFPLPWLAAMPWLASMPAPPFAGAMQPIHVWAVIGAWVPGWPAAAMAMNGDWMRPETWLGAGRVLDALRGSEAPFATYRSDSGHAVTRITFPNDVVATVSIPPHAVAWPGADLWRCR